MPARKGSKRLRNKNRLAVGDRSLLQRTIDLIRAVGLLEQTVISTDDEVLAEQAGHLGVTVPYLRPSHLARDDSSTIDVLRFVLEDLNSNFKWLPKYVLLLQLTSPFRDPSTVEYAMNLIQKHEECPAIVSGKISNIENEKTIGRVSDDLLIETTKITGEFVEADGNFYVAHVSALLSSNTFLPDGTKVIISTEYQSIDIDTLEDFELAQDVCRAFYKI